MKPSGGGTTSRLKITPVYKTPMIRTKFVSRRPISSDQVIEDNSSNRILAAGDVSRSLFFGCNCMKNYYIDLDPSLDGLVKLRLITRAYMLNNYESLLYT